MKGATARKYYCVNVEYWSFHLQAKQQIEQYGVKHTMSPERVADKAAGKRRSDVPSRHATPQSSPLNRNSVPPQVLEHFSHGSLPVE